MIFFQCSSLILCRFNIHSNHFFTDLDLALSQLTSSDFLAIDNRKKLIKKIQSNVPIAYFPGRYIKNELEFFVLQAVRSRLELNIEEELTEDILEKNAEHISKIYVFASEKATIENYNYDSLVKFVEESYEKELYLLYKYGILEFVKNKII